MLNYNVLIVEDNHDVADTTAGVLEAFGFHVRVAYDGTSGLRAALADPPDAVLCDIRMPGLNGFEVARRIRDGLTPKPLLIAVTASMEQEIVEPAGRAGFDHYFLKPADPLEIGGLLADHAGGRAH
ncbi:MAG TPA: response regulator [Gemmataceae bacterium]|nr:response regulator [Gemmataceae bacterium]